MPIVGDTIRLKGEFKDWEGNYADPNDVKVKIYDQNKTIIKEVAAVKEGVGKYYYDYTVLLGDFSVPIIFEFSGSLEGSIILGRKTFFVKFI